MPHLQVSIRGGGSSLDALVRLDAIKSRLTTAAQALRQADNWTTLATEVEEVTTNNSCLNLPPVMVKT